MSTTLEILTSIIATAIAVIVMLPVIKFKKKRQLTGKKPIWTNKCIR